MSPDDIFAAQFWPWPDPAIKRDAQGRVLFVNAAFLALYGGQVENWRGNAIGGWPAPQAAGSAPYRFETRIPSADRSEKVYDWMEQTLDDGNAFALARDVTIFAQAPQPDPAASQPPAESQLPQEAQIETAAPADTKRTCLFRICRTANSDASRIACTDRICGTPATGRVRPACRD
jgi:hypothetical protein